MIGEKFLVKTFWIRLNKVAVNMEKKTTSLKPLEDLIKKIIYFLFA